ncbi:MAG TPA: hypothetical protein VGM29_14180 [Polyangiaceae bacterium]|jgi:hypothetical protein
MHHRSLISPLLLALAVACGGAQPAPEAPPAPATPEAPAAPSAAPAAPETPAPSTSAAPAEPAAPAAWADDLPVDQKKAFMKAVVMPRMSKVFQAFNADHYKDFSCHTCHGQKFSLTQEALPKLTFAGGKMTAFKDKPEVAKFMMDKVEPEMASIFGKPVFDMKTKQGFGCNGCHTVDMKK